MRISSLSAALFLSLGTTGCAGLLGLDDFTEGEATGPGGTESTSSTLAGPSSGTDGSGGATGAPSSTATEAGPGSGGGGGDGGGGSTPGELVVTPDEPKVGILRPLQLEASLDVDWTVEEEGGGTIDEAGRYVSPFEPGTYHVVATSVDDASLTETVEITVVPLRVRVVGGIPGGPGNIDGQARRAHFDNPLGVGLDRDDNRKFYVADSDNHTIRFFDDDTGLVTTLAGKAGEPGAVDGPGADARFDSPTHLVVDGSIYVTDHENDCIRQINPVTGATTTLSGQCGVSGNVDGSNGASSRFDRIESMVLGPAGTALYVCTQNAIRRVNRSTGATSTVIASLSTPNCQLSADSWRGDIFYTAYDSGLPTVRRFPDPYVAVEDVYVADYPPNAQGLVGINGIGGEDHLYTLINDYDEDLNGYRSYLYRVEVDDETTFQEYLGGEEGYVDGDIADVRLHYTSFLSAHRDWGYVFFNDRNGTVRRLDVFDEEVETVLGPIPNDHPVDGGRTVARIPSPIAIALDGQGSLFETNFGENDNRIRRIDIETGAIESFSGVGDVDGDLVDGGPDEASFGIAADVVYLDGNLYVTDYQGNAVRRVDATTGEVETIAGQLNVPGNSDGVGAAAGFRFSGGDGIGGGITTDGTDLYVCDTENYKIKRIDLSSGTVTTIAGGTQGDLDGIGDQAQFSSPASINFSGGYLYVAEFLTHTVRRIDLSNNAVTTIAGRAGEAGHADGGLGTSTLTNPIRVAADGLGNLYVSEFQGNVIRRIALDGNQTTTFMGTVGARGFNAAPLPTTLNCPTALLVDPNGDLLFGDACDGVVGIVEAL